MNDITVLIPVSAMPSHPSSEVIDQTLASIRERLPTSEIIIMFDGVAPALMELKGAYDQHIQNMLWRIEHEFENVTPIVFDRASHQSTMVTKALSLVKTPMILFCEQDTPLHNEIPFPEIAEVVRTGYANVVRFHHEASVHPEHQHLMLDQEPISVLGVPMIRTYQWSGRPHLASTEFYRRISREYFRDNMFIEHIMYGVCVEGNYDEFRVHLYAPANTQVRSIHLDGRRKGAENYDPNPS